MKPILPLFFLFFLLASFAAAEIPVSSYPYFFDQHDYDVLIVVGGEAPSEHVLAGADIATSIISVSQSTDVRSGLAEEVSNYEQDMVVIGTPCTNSITKLLFEKSECDIAKKGDAIITVLEGKSGNIFLMVAGNTPESNRIAAKVLQEPHYYDLDDDLICVWGTLEHPHAMPCSESTYTGPTSKSTSSSSSATTTQQEETTTSTTPKSTFVKKDIEVVTQKTIDIDCPEGCKDEEGLCFSVGEQHIVKNQRAYCKADNLWYPLKAEGKSCVDNYQCSTDYCDVGVCSEKPQEGFLKRFFSWLFGAFFE